MKAFKIPLEISLGALLLAGLLASTAMAQAQDKNNESRPNTSVPVTPENRSGLPPAPPDIVPPGSAARPFTGNEATQPSRQTTTVPKDLPVVVPK